MRRYEYKRGQYALAMEACEEKALIGSYCEIEGRVKSEPWPAHFQYHFFTSGVGASLFYIDQINRVRNRIGLAQITFIPTEPQDYCRLKDLSLKANRRSTWLRDYREMDTAGQVAWLRDALEAMKALPPCLDPSVSEQPSVDRYEPRRVFDGNILSPRERAIRTAALEKSNGGAAPSIEATFGLSSDKIVRQLELAQELPEPGSLIGQIVANVAPGSALDLAAQFNHPAIRTALIQRSMEAA